MRPCCEVEDNRVLDPPDPAHPERQIRVCRVCQARHIEVTIDPAQFGVTVKG